MRTQHAMHQRPGHRARAAAPPVLSLPVLRELERQLGGDTAGTVAFVRSYIGLWGGRYARLAGAVRAWNEDEALDAALSLKSSSQMVGAQQLQHLAAELELELRRRHRSCAAGLLKHLQICGAETMSVLQERYLRGSR